MNNDGSAVACDTAAPPRQASVAGPAGTFLTLPLPPSANNLFANSARGGRRKTPKYTAWIKAAGWELRRQTPKHVPGTVAISYRIPWPTDKRKRDIANREKALSDLLVSHQVIEDDSLIVSLHLDYGVVNQDGLVEVAIRPKCRELHPAHDEFAA